MKEWFLIIHTALIFCISSMTYDLHGQGIQFWLAALDTIRDDVEKIEVHIGICDYLRSNGTQDEADVHCLKALELAEKIDYKKGIASAYLSMGNNHGMHGDFEGSKEFFNKGIAIATPLNEYSILAGCHNGLSIVHRSQGDYDKALQHGHSCLQASEKLQDSGSISKAYSTLGNLYNHQGNHSLALEYHLKSIKLGEMVGDSAICMSGYLNAAHCYGASGRIGDAKQLYNNALAYATALNDRYAISNVYESLGIIASRDDLAKAMDYHEKSLALRQELGLTYEIATSFMNIAGLYHRQLKFKEAILYTLESLKIRESIDDQWGIADCYVGFGMIAIQQEKHDEALQYFLKYKEICTSIENYVGVAEAFSYIGQAYSEKNELDSALHNFQLSHQMHLQAGNNFNIALTALNIGTVLSKLKRHHEAIDYYELGLHQNVDHGDSLFIAMCYINLADAYIALNDPGKARPYLEKSLVISKRMGSVNELQLSYLNLSKIDSLEGHFIEAYENFKKYAAYRDTFNVQTNDREIAEIKEKYESEKKDSEILRLQMDKQLLESERKISRLERDKLRQQNLLHQADIRSLAYERNAKLQEANLNEAKFISQKAETDKKISELAATTRHAELTAMNNRKQQLIQKFMIAGLACLLLMSFLAYRNYHTQQQLKLQKLRNKIASDLHDDVGSTLSSISIFSQMAQQQQQDVGPLLNTIEESSRKMLDAMADIVWTINPENDQLEKIIVRMRNFAFEFLGTRNIDFEFLADERVSDMKLPMDVRKNLYLIFKEATNNMVKYSGADKARFTLTEENDGLTMEIRDNGKGFDPARVREGNGLKNMKKRAEEIGGKLWIESRNPGGTTIRLKVAV